MSESGYRSPQAVNSALSARARKAAAQVSRPSGQLRREFIYSRFLARVFLDSTWVLKGGTALLARVRSARHTTDVDLLAAIDDLDAAVASLERACQIDLGDHFRFTITSQTALTNTQQPQVDGCQVRITAYLGTRVAEQFKVDVVTGSLMTQEPDVQVPPVLELDGLQAPAYRLYPVVDHVADKLCATEMRYGPDELPSSRARDLVDLMVLARSGDMDGDELTAAITAERAHRRLPARSTLEIPAGWARKYPTESAGVEACAGIDFAGAVAFVEGFLGPVLAGRVSGRRWSAADGTWN